MVDKTILVRQMVPLCIQSKLQPFLTYPYLGLYATKLYQLSLFHRFFVGYNYML